MAERKFVGETLKTDVIKQLEIREQLLGNPQTNPDNYILFKNGNNAWIRVISGVDVRAQETGEYTSKVAQNFVLSGGELFWDATSKTFKKREGFKASSSSSNGRYTFDETLGIRPEGGITDFSIQNIQRFGTIRKAQIQFLVWTLKDLERAQDIYFRPGMSLIAEWGNSSYISNDNNFIDLANPKETKKFFERINFTDARTLQELDASSAIDKVISKNIEDSSYNYDGFVGLISNFSWSLRPDGGYDCTLTVVSKGTLLSSLSVVSGKDSIRSEAFNSIPEEFFTKRPLPEASSEENEEPGFIQGAKNLWGRLTGDPNVSDLPADTDIESKERLSLMHFFCSKVEEIDIQDLEEGFVTYSTFNSSVFSEQGLQRSEQVNDKYYRIRKPNPLIPFLKEELGDREEDFTVVGFDGKVDKESAKFRYISLRTFLALINIAYLGGSKNKLLPTFSTNINRYGEYETFANHFSFDPASVILPKSPTQTPELFAPKQTVAGWISKEFVLNSSTIGEETTTLAKIFPRLLGRSDSTLVPVTDILVNNVSENIQKRLTLPGGRSTEVVGTRPQNNILNIFISTRLIIQKLDALYSRNAVPEELDILTYVNSILQEINSVLGGINDLEVAYTAGNDAELAYIVDRAKINPDLTQDNTAEINIRGLKNTVSSVELKTFISSKLGAQISISATGGSENSIDSNLGLIKYNDGKRDRFRINYKTLTEEEAKALPQSIQDERFQQLVTDSQAEYRRLVDRNKKFDKFLINIADAYAKFNNTIFGDAKKSQYRTSLFSKIKGEGISRTKAVLARKYLGTEQEPQNVLPLELSITLNGISGLTVGEVFKLKKNSSVLPKNYEEFGYIITALDSQIQNNKWVTTIKANLFRLQKTSAINSAEASNLEKYTRET